MKKVSFKTKGKAKTFSRRAPHAFAIIQALGNDRSRFGLTVPDISESLTGNGVLYPGKNELQGISVLLQELLDAGIVKHPVSKGSTRRYVLAEYPDISFI